MLFQFTYMDCTMNYKTHMEHISTFCMSVINLSVSWFGNVCNFVVVVSGCSSTPTSLNLAQKATNHQVTTMLATSKNTLFPGHNQLLTTGIDDLTL